MTLGTTSIIHADSDIGGSLLQETQVMYGTRHCSKVLLVKLVMDAILLHRSSGSYSVEPLPQPSSDDDETHNLTSVSAPRL